MCGGGQGTGKTCGGKLKLKHTGEVKGLPVGFPGLPCIPAQCQLNLSVVHAYHMRITGVPQTQGLYLLNMAFVSHSFKTLSLLSQQKLNLKFVCLM